MEPQGEQAQHDLRHWDGDPAVDVSSDPDAVPTTTLYEWAAAGKLIYPAMIHAMRLVKAVGKEGWNDQQKYKFRGIDGVLDAVGPALRAAGIFVTSEIIEITYRDTRTTQDKPTREVTTRIRYTFHAADGSSITTEVAGESLDQSDKGTAKAFSVALRIALLQTLALPTQDATTDDTAHYHTRGADSLTGWTRSYGQALLVAEVPDVEKIMQFWPAIVETAQMDAPVSGNGTGVTWHEMVAETLSRAIAATNTADEGRALYNLLKPSGALHWVHDGVKLGARMEERAKEIFALMAKVFDHCMELVTSAADAEALDAAMLHVRADTTPNGALTVKQFEQIKAVAEERYLKLVNAVEQREFLPASGPAWQDFCSWVDLQNRLPSDIREALEGQWDKAREMPPAAEWGLPGLLRLIDAVKRSNKRDETITDTQRAELLDEIMAAATAYGITIPEANL